MHKDRRGLEMTTASAEAAEHLDQAVADYLDYQLSASGHVKAALEADPDFILAQCFRGYFFLMLEVKAILPRVEKLLAQIRPNLAAVSKRERLHVEALAAWAAGDIMKACLRWEEILTDAPHDLLALKLHHTMAFYTGRSQVLRSVVSSALGQWHEGVPGYGYVQGMYAYALEECGAYEEAERWGREATERNPEDLWAIHSVAHVLEMQGRSAEGLRWLDYAPERWADKNPFKAHVWWHKALFALAQGEYDRALSLYDNELCSVNTETNVDVSNQAALLKRLQINGVDIGQRWQALAAHSRGRIHDHMLPFRDAHYCLALAANGDVDAAQKHVQSMVEMSADGDSWRPETTRKILIPLCEGMIAYEQGDYGKACDILWPMRNDLTALGGSHAQRDLFAQILCEAAVRADRLTLARGLWSERVMRRGTVKRNWQTYADVLTALGDAGAAQRAQRQVAAAPEVGG